MTLEIEIHNNVSCCQIKPAGSAGTISFGRVNEEKCDPQLPVQFWILKSYIRT